jgi:hypothetical protein
MMLIRVRVLGEFIHREFHIARASFRPLCGSDIYRDKLIEELQTAEINYAALAGNLRMCGACVMLLIRATEDATRDCQRIGCFITNECECITAALRGRNHH